MGFCLKPRPNGQQCLAEALNIEILLFKHNVCQFGHHANMHVLEKHFLARDKQNVLIKQHL